MPITLQSVIYKDRFTVEPGQSWQVSGVRAVGSGAAGVPVLVGGASVTGVAAAGAGVAPVPVVSAAASGSVTAVVAVGVGAGRVPVVSGVATGAVTAVVAAATGVARVPAVVGVRNATVAAVRATGTGLVTAPSTGATTLASETWTGTNGAGWPGQWTTTANSGTIDIQSNKGRMLTTATAFSHGPSAYLSGMTAVGDMEVVTSFTIPTPESDMFMIISLRCSSFPSASADPTTGYELIFYHDGSAWLRYSTGGGTTGITTQTGYVTTSPGMVIGVRFQIVGTALKARIWDKAGSEPGTWTITATDANIAGTGKVGLSAFNGSAVVHSLLWDDLTVTTPSSGGGAIDLRFDFETGDFTQFTAGGHGDIEAANPSAQAVIVTSPVRQGTYAAQIQVRPGDVWDNGSIRCLLARYDTNEEQGDDYYYGLSIRVPTAITRDELVWEMHQRDNIYSPNGVFNGNLSLAPHGILIEGGNLTYRLMSGSATWNGSSWGAYEIYDPTNILISSANFTTNTWFDIIIHINFQEISGGAVEVWVRKDTDAWPSSPTWSRLNVPTMQWIPGGYDPAIPTDIHNYTAASPAPSFPWAWGLFTTIGLYPGTGSISTTDTMFHDGYRRGTSFAAVLAEFPAASAGNVAAVRATGTGVARVPTVPNGSVTAVVATGAGVGRVPAVSGGGNATVVAVRATGSGAAQVPVVPLASETWTGSNGAGWPAQWTTQANGGTIDIQSNKGRMLMTATGFVTGPTAYLSGMAAVGDMEVLTSFTIPTPDSDMFHLVCVRCSTFAASSADPTTGYELIFYHDGSAWLRVANSGTTGLTTQTNYLSTSVGMVIGVRFQIIGSTLNARIWDKAGAEPGTWQITTTDATIGGTGKVGLSSFNGSAAVKSTVWDDLTVKG